MSKRTHSDAGNAIAKVTASLLLAEDRAIVKKRGGKITDEEYADAIERLMCGDTMRNVTKDLGVSRAALLVRADTDADFANLLFKALAMGVWTGLENGENMLLGGDLSTGSFQRDKEYVDFQKWKAARLNRGIFGDRVQIDQRTVTVNLPGFLDGL